MARSRVVSCGLCLVFVSLLCVTPASASSSESRNGFTKLMRGLINTTTGWVEIPKRIHETATTSGVPAGLTWGFLRGLGYGFVRTAAGLYEAFTFPVPAPPDFEPVIQPEYVFTSDTDTH